MQIVKQSLVVSIHDVTPSTQTTTQEMMDDLKQLGVSHCSLLVVPHYHHKESLTTSPSFVTWLREKEREGHEIVLHGWSHLRPIALKEGCWKRWITQHYTRGEGEFYDLSYDEAREKLKKGKEEFEKAGFELQKISGFIAPAWLLSKEAERAVADEHFSYTTRLHGVINLTRVFHTNAAAACESEMQSPLRLGTHRYKISSFKENPPTFFRAQSMVYSVSSRWRRGVSLIWNEFLLRLADRQAWPLVRLGLHPPDWKYPAIRKHALSTVARIRRKRKTLTYHEWTQNEFFVTS